MMPTLYLCTSGSASCSTTWVVATFVPAAVVALPSSALEVPRAIIRSSRRKYVSSFRLLWIGRPLNRSLELQDIHRNPLPDIVPELLGSGG